MDGTSLSYFLLGKRHLAAAETLLVIICILMYLPYAKYLHQMLTNHNTFEIFLKSHRPQGGRHRHRRQLLVVVLVLLDNAGVVVQRLVLVPVVALSSLGCWSWGLAPSLGNAPCQRVVG